MPLYNNGFIGLLKALKEGIYNVSPDSNSGGIIPPPPAGNFLIDNDESFLVDNDGVNLIDNA